VSPMDKVREFQNAVCDQVRTNALAEGGLQPVAFLIAQGSVRPVVMTETGNPKAIYSATDELARKMGAETALLAFELVARRTDTPAAFSEIMDEGVIRPPSQSEDRTPAIMWHRFANGRCETEAEVFEAGKWHPQGAQILAKSPVPYFRTDRSAANAE
jgi:hypothetical protein